MEVEKREAKGVFSRLFNWNAKSRKKLFSSKSDLHENLNQGKEKFQDSEAVRVRQGLEDGFVPNARDHNVYHYASSVCGESEFATKAPGVVARLMGLDSLPTTDVTEPCFTPFMESHSFRDSNYLRPAPEFQSEHDVVISEGVRSKLDGFTSNSLDLRLQKVHNRPIERFQTEVLPPKSAKPISITQHPLLSPIKSPGFIPTKNAAYIIEAAAKIIEQSPRSTVTGKLPSLGSSCVPIRVQDLKEKMESAQRSSRPADASEKGKEHNSIRNVKKQPSTKGQGLSGDSYLYKGFEESKRIGSQRLTNEEKSASLAVQAKANVQKRDGKSSVGKRSSRKQKEHLSDTKSSNVSSNLLDTQRAVEKQSLSRKPLKVLRPNHHQQNCPSIKGGENEPSHSHTKDVKEPCLSNNYIYERAQRSVDKIVVNNGVMPRKTNAVATYPGKELSSSREKRTSKKKLNINGKIQSGVSVAEIPLGMKDEKSVRYNAASVGDCEWDTIDKKNSLEVVSFTFTSPIKKLGSNSCGTVMKIPSCNPSAHESDLRNSAASSLGSNVIGGDLSALLEQKLKELTLKVELSQQDLSETGSFSTSADSNVNMCPIVSLSNLPPTFTDICKGKQEIQNASDCLSIDNHRLEVEKETKELKHVEEDGNDNVGYQKYNTLLQSSSVSSLPSFSEASCDSFDANRSNGGSMQCLSLESYEGTKSSTMKSRLTDGDVEISDTASSFSVGTISETVASSLYMPDTNDTSCWELQYIEHILCNAELMLEEFAVGRADTVISPHLFHQLESKKMGPNKSTDQHSKIQRKLLFDCVGECLEVRCERLLAGSQKVWAKQTTLFHKKQRLAEELYREISSWKNIEELMVDELVDKDMNCRNGKWTDFETEAFEEGLEIEKRILTSLVDELIHDILF
ncbi:hypothetical protein Salat_1651100 [Sesamum alatum]|uniref:DUF4378 domain-containing protein n=1 Tax=Sesamum alatum TaxID=300844 RepID=A0AAE1Y7D5_9LAMI|nr:hypothetical protein Salat_1651100 [Sesamum alatum]